jgi:hypothetical protein
MQRMGEQAALAVANGDAGLVAGSFDTQNTHIAMEYIRLCSPWSAAILIG